MVIVTAHFMTKSIAGPRYTGAQTLTLSSKLYTALAKVFLRELLLSEVTLGNKKHIKMLYVKCLNGRMFSPSVTY